jgi:hypothetical protein
MSMKNFNDTIGSRTCDLPDCSALPKLMGGGGVLSTILKKRYMGQAFSTNKTCDIWLGFGQTKGHKTLRKPRLVNRGNIKMDV